MESFGKNITWILAEFNFEKATCTVFNFLCTVYWDDVVVYNPEIIGINIYTWMWIKGKIDLFGALEVFSWEIEFSHSLNQIVGPSIAVLSDL